MRLSFCLVPLLLAGCAALPAGTPQGSTMMIDENASAVDRTRAALARIERLNPQVGAVIATDPTALDQARRVDAAGREATLLKGMPILLKDNIESAGPLPTTAGSLALIDNVTGRDAPLVARLRAAGAVIVGKSNLSEWANIRDDDSISGWSAVGGQTRNAYALNRNPCGSSSGSAVAVSAGMVPAAIGTETDGSITCPASVNGIVGFKPTVGLVSRARIVPISISQDTAGPMTRTVRDAALVLEAMAGADAGDRGTADADRNKVRYSQQLSDDALRGKRIGVMRFATGFGTDAAFEEALATLRAQGAELVDIKEFPGNRGEIGRNEFTVLLHELKTGLNEYLATTPPSVTTRTLADVIAFNRRTPAETALFDQTTFEQAEATDGTDSEAYRKARETSLRIAGPEGIDRLLKDNKVVALVGPTRGAAWLIDTVHGDIPTGGGAGSLAAVAGYPHLTVPMGLVRGLPVGLSFIGPKWSDALVLSLGYDYEQASRKRVDPRFLRSIEEDEAVAPLLQPAPRPSR